jgi:hypothetical protein
MLPREQNGVVDSELTVPLELSIVSLMELIKYL